jgi:aspartate aminotransferase
MRKYTIFIDGISKSLAATGVRVGWATGPRNVIDKMKAILSHVGAWAPKAEQVAVAEFLKDKKAVNEYLVDFKHEIDERLQGFYKGFIQLKNEGFSVDAIAPQAAIYLTVKLNLKGKKTRNGAVLSTQPDVTQFILDEAKLGLVPFSAFGTSTDFPWYRLSVGTCHKSEIPVVFESLRAALKSLS